MSLFRFFVRKPFALVVLFCLSTGLLFTGCKTDDDGDPVARLDAKLIGTWTSIYDDAYTITGEYLSYGYGVNSISYAGTIKWASQFTSDAGVIIIEYDADHKPTYYDSFENYGDPDHLVELKGNFIGIYYKDLKPGVSVQIGGAYSDGGAEEATLGAAKKTFTMGNEGKYIGSYGTYKK
jgi:hypothetical protein